MVVTQNSGSDWTSGDLLTYNIALGSDIVPFADFFDYEVHTPLVDLDSYFVSDRCNRNLHDLSIDTSPLSSVLLAAKANIGHEAAIDDFAKDIGCYVSLAINRR